MRVFKREEHRFEVMDIQNRVQIIPLGYEYVRVKEPINQLKADRVVIVEHLASENYEAEFQRELITELRSNDRLEVETRECDIFDLRSSLATLGAAIRDHSGDDVYVNLATGTKITAIAGMLACQLTRATPFYVAPRFEGESGSMEPPKDPLVTSIGKIFDVPLLETIGPNEDQLHVLSYLAEIGQATKKELIQFCLDEELAFIRDSETKSDEGRYRLLDTNIIGPLEADSYIAITKSGRKKYVSLTERGRNHIETFQSIL